MIYKDVITDCPDLDLCPHYLFTGSCMKGCFDAYNKAMHKNESCTNCVHCKVLYTPPTIHEPPKYGWCCTLFANEGEVMRMQDGTGMCECFKEKKVEE